MPFRQGLYDFLAVAIWFQGSALEKWFYGPQNCSIRKAEIQCDQGPMLW
jgi:hypothetical protein